MTKDADIAALYGEDREEEIAWREDAVEAGGQGRSPRRMTRRQRRHWRLAVDVRRRIETDIHEFLNPNGVPPEWHEIWEDPDRRDPKRTRCTVAFDADLVRFFKAMGPGYQVRMNRVLRAFMELHLSGLIDGPDANRYVDQPSLVLAENLKREEEWGEEPEGDDPADAHDGDPAEAARTDAERTDAEAWAEARRAVRDGEWEAGEWGRREA